MQDNTNPVSVPAADPVVVAPVAPVMETPVAAVTPAPAQVGPDPVVMPVVEEVKVEETPIVTTVPPTV